MNKIPFIHYFGEFENNLLISPFESKDSSQTGSFYAPVNENNELFKRYYINYSVYEGNGVFAKNKQNNDNFLAMAIKNESKTKPYLFLKLARLNTSVKFTGYEEKDFPDNNVKFPLIKKKPFFKMESKKIFHYGGSCKHPDFKLPFVKLTFWEPSQLDKLLKNAKISLTGCNPHKNYCE